MFTGKKINKIKWEKIISSMLQILKKPAKKIILFSKKALFSIRTKQLRNKLLHQKMDKIFEKVCLSILDKNFKEAMATFSTECLLKNINCSTQQFLDSFLNHPDIVNILRGSKAKYYEFFLSLADPVKRLNLSKQLYGDEWNDIKYIREMIAFSKIDESTKNGLFRDRLHEWGLIFNNKKIPYLSIALLQNKFEEQDLNNNTKLFDALIKLAPLYSLRLMECPDLLVLQRLLKLVRVLEKKNTPLKILEYGCGSADASILLAKRGHKPTICDIEGGNLAAAQKRFKQRFLEVKSAGVNQKYPVFPINDKFDIIIATEVLEHIRKPIKLLELIYKSLNNDGMVMFGSFPFNETDDRGDHLEEAVSKRFDLLSWINIHFNRFSDINAGNVFIKKNK